MGGNGHHSPCLKINTGACQGSLQEMMLFNVFINDLGNVVSNEGAKFAYDSEFLG